MTSLLQIDGETENSSKVGYYRDRVKAWQRGERVPPITMDVSLSRRCNASCGFCVFPDTPVLMSNGKRKRMADVVPGDGVLSLDAAGNIRSSLVTSQWQTSPMRGGLQIVTTHGILKCTSNHLIRSDSGWVEAVARYSEMHL